MVQVNVHEAKTHLSRLLSQVEHGEVVVIARDGRPVAQLTPVGPIRPRELGFVPFEVPDSFFEPLSEDELAEWED